MASAAQLRAAVLLSVVALQLVSVHCQSDIPKYIKSNPKFSKFATLLSKSVLAKKLTASSAVTLFAPNNAALPTAVFNRLNKLSSADLDHQIISYHIIQEPLAAAALTTGAKLKTLRYVAPDEFTLLVDKASIPGSTIIRGLYSAAKVVKADIKVGKSYVHEIDTALLLAPATKPKYRTIREAAVALKLKVFLASVAAYKPQYDLLAINKLVTTPSPGTAFATSDAAFKAWTVTNKCSPKFNIISNYEMAYSFSNDTLPLARLSEGLLISTLNIYDEAEGTGPPQQLKVVYVKGKPTIWAQPDRKVRRPFFSANIVDSVLTERGVLHVIDNVLYPYNPGEGVC